MLLEQWQDAPIMFESIWQLQVHAIDTSGLLVSVVVP
jgi:hypothetical protein